MNISSNQNGNNETKHDDVKPTFIPKVKSNKKFRKKRSIDDVSINQPSDSKQEPQDEEDYATKLEKARLLKQLRSIKNRGSDMTADAVGYTKDSGSKEDKLLSLDENFVSHEESKSLLEKRMEDFIEQEMEKKKRQKVEDKDEDKPTENSEEKNSEKTLLTSSTDTKTKHTVIVRHPGIHEVELPEEYKRKNIEETQIATQKLIMEKELKKQKSQKNEQKQDEIPANFNVNFRKYKRDEKASLGTKATDDIVYENFKRKYQYRM